jgi:nucleoside 2-deoxyribosyltransferase
MKTPFLSNIENWGFCDYGGQTMGGSVMKCYFCDYDGVTDVYEQYLGSKPPAYRCDRCGMVNLEQDTADLLETRDFNQKEKQIISIYIRNEFEKRGRKPPRDRLDMAFLDTIVRTYRELDALEKMDNALLNIEKLTVYVGYSFSLNLETDYPYYHCFQKEELTRIIQFLLAENLIDTETPVKAPHLPIRITSKGYARLRELKKHQKDSRQCFVAMWFTPEMANVYHKAIQPGIEYVEEGETEPRFKALAINQKEHTNDINDEIISEIRRSGFMVCDITGYRGGVYWEAGFAYGLGLEVIYTCREDWVKPRTEKLVLYDGTVRDMKQEGIHFDLEHRNRIEWKDSNLSELRERLTTRIKAVVI